MLDLTVENPISLAEVCRIVPPGHSGRRTHLSTVLRWVLTGARSPSGELVQLEALRIGGRWMSTREALQRFAERLTPTINRSSVETRTVSRRQRESERAGQELEALGI
jgi:Protein of unknown function (DUF1580)